MAGAPKGPFPPSFLQDTAPFPSSPPNPSAAFFNPGMTAMHSARLIMSFEISESGALTSSSTTFEDSQRRSAIFSSTSNNAKTMKSVFMPELLFQNWYHFRLYRQTCND